MTGLEGSAEGQQVRFRGYEEGDMPSFARIAKEAWPAAPETGFQKHELAGMKEYMSHSMSVSNWTDVALAPDGVAGFLMGRIDNLPGVQTPKSSPLGELPYLILSFFQESPELLSDIRFLLNIFFTEIKVKLKTPRSDAAIEMFIVASRHRGKGIGTALLDRFLETAAKAGATRVSVYTDDTMSDWQFYERRGFERVGTFKDNITSQYSGVRSTGIVFVLDLKGRPTDLARSD